MFQSPPKYAYSYGVKDFHTGDFKNQWETREGDVVKGSYTILEPDGTTRIVDYTADKHNGFTAVVRKEAGHAQASTQSVVAAEASYEQPVVVAEASYEQPEQTTAHH